MSSNDDSDIFEFTNLSSFFSAVGELCLAWSYLETSIDGVIEIIHEDWGANEMGEELPRSAFIRKTSFIRKWAVSGNRPELFPDLTEWLDVVERLADDRHWIIHGAMLEVGALEEVGVVHLSRMHKKTRKTETATTDIPHIQRLRTALLAWASMFGFLEAILNNASEEESEALRELAVRFFRGLEVQDETLNSF